MLNVYIFFDILEKLFFLAIELDEKERNGIFGKIQRGNNSTFQLK